MNPPDVINPQKKVCYKCHDEKPISEFNKCKTGIYGYHNHCRECQRIVKSNWAIKNSNWIKEYASRPENLAANNARQTKKYHTDPQWREKNLAESRKRRRLEPAKIKARIQRANWLEIPHNKIAQNLRGRIRVALKGMAKMDFTEQLTGCTFNELKLYLESLFQSGMTWDNYGEWHIDHKRPCASFDLTKLDQQRECFHYTNLQPLWAADNISKSDKIQ